MPNYWQMKILKEAPNVEEKGVQKNFFEEEKTFGGMNNLWMDVVPWCYL